MKERLRPSKPSKSLKERKRQSRWRLSIPELSVRQRKWLESFRKSWLGAILAINMSKHLSG